MIKSYKYRTGATALRCLSEGSLFFSPPALLNDILEAKFEMAGEKEFFHEFSEAINELASDRGHQARISPEQMPIGLAAETQKENVALANACQSIGIYSASIRPDNQPLWAYYADNFKGVCFELEWTDDVLSEYEILPVNVSYLAGQKVINRAEDLKDLLLLVGKSNPSWSLAQIGEYALSEDFRRYWGVMNVLRAVTGKHADWAHEQEIRFIAPNSGGISLLSAVLKKVFYVTHEFPEWASIVRLVAQLYPNVELIEIKFSHRDPIVSSRKVEIKQVPIDS